jgi:hypothetical protein
LLLPPIAAWFAPGLNRALRERLTVVGNDEVGIVPENIAEALALRTGAEWMVERKKDRTNRFERSPTSLTAKVRAVGSGSLIDDLYAAQALAFVKGRLDRFDEARAVVFPDYEPIEDHIKIIQPCFGKGLDLMEIEDLLAAPHSGKPAYQ